MQMLMAIAPSPYSRGRPYRTWMSLADPMPDASGHPQAIA